MTRVAGIDAARKHWVGVTSDLRTYAATTIDALLAAADADGVLDVVAIDIPIGLPLNGPRRADICARTAIGPRASSVFGTPPREMLLAPSYAEAGEVSRRLTGNGISQQSWAMREKILEVDTVVRGHQRTIIEIHPEVLFATLANHPLRSRKSTWAGFRERLALLAREGIALPDDLGSVGHIAAPNDVLDAAVASWSADRYCRGVAISLPAQPEQFDGITAAIYA